MTEDVAGHGDLADADLAGELGRGQLMIGEVFLKRHAALIPIRYQERKRYYTGSVLDGQFCLGYRTGMTALRQIRKAVGLTQAEAAERAGMNQPTYQRLESGKMKMTREYAEQLAPAFSIDPAQIMFGPPSPSDDAGPQIVGLVGAGGEMSHFSEGQGPFGTAPAPPGATAATVAVEIRGDSLGPTFNGWLAFFDDRRDPPDESLIGHLCVVGLPDGRAYIKKLRPGRKSKTYDLLSHFGDPLEDQKVEWAARVIALMPRAAA